jgi:hypothetical protein
MKYAIENDLLQVSRDIRITSTLMGDGSQKWELHFEYPKENCPGQWVPHTEPIEPDDPSMTDEDDRDYDVWCFHDFVDINFWREYDLAGEVIHFSIYPVEEITEDNTDSWGKGYIGSTFTNTNVDPVRGIVEFLK